MEEQTTAQPFALPVRGLVQKEGKWLQPIQLTLRHSGADAAAVTRLDGQEIDRRTLHSWGFMCSMF